MTKIANCKRYLGNMTVDTQLYLVSLIVSLMLSSFFVLTEYWQLILIAGLISGALNKKMKKGALSGAIGVSLVWFFFMINAIMTRNAFENLDQFSAFIIGDLGYGWVLFIIILLLGALFGALSGAIGSGISILLMPIVQDKKAKSLSNNEEAIIKNIQN